MINAHSQQVLYVGSKLGGTHVCAAVHSDAVDEHESELSDAYGVPGILREPITYFAHARVLPSVVE